MNRGIGNGHRPAAGESRTGRLFVPPSVSEPLPVVGAEVAASTADLRRQGRSGNPARSAEPARSQPSGAELR